MHSVEVNYSLSAYLTSDEVGTYRPEFGPDWTSVNFFCEYQAVLLYKIK